MNDECVECEDINQHDDDDDDDDYELAVADSLSALCKVRISIVSDCCILYHRFCLTTSELPVNCSSSHIIPRAVSCVAQQQMLKPQHSIETDVSSQK